MVIVAEREFARESVAADSMVGLRRARIVLCVNECGRTSDRRARRRSEEWATKLLQYVMRYCRCDEGRGGNDMPSLACTAVLLPTWRAVVASGRVRDSGQQHCSALFSSTLTLPDTTPVDCFISRVESMLQIPQMRSN